MIAREVAMLALSASRILATAAILILGSTMSIAGDVVQTDDSRIWRAGIDGVEVEWANDGTVRRISSQASQPVQFPDRRGIRKAQTIAEEKAKAAIIRWLKQESFTSRVVTEINQDLETASRERSGDGDSWSKTNQRTMVENLNEVVGSFAKGSLRGVMILERGYDEGNEEAWVKVGISKKSIAATGQVNNMLKGKDDGTSCNSENGCNGMNSGSEVERLEDPDW
jgi:hypothetical protein